jgi:hypothetical protein
MRSIRMGSPTSIRQIRTRALAVLTAVALLTLALGVGVASAHDGRHHGDAGSTFTKYVSSYPVMAGVVGGEVGPGTFAGEILKYTLPTATTPKVIEALYHFNGLRHSFSALVHVEQAGLEAVIIGVVTDGWLKGHQVEGKYTQIACTQAPNGICFQGSLDILRGYGD